MSIIMHNRGAPIQNLLLNPHPVLPPRSQAHTMSNNAQPFNAFSCSKSRRSFHRPLHNTSRNVWIGRGFPVSDIVRPAENRASACSALHDVRNLRSAIISPRRGNHRMALVPHENDLCSSRRHGSILDASKLERSQRSSVDDDVCRLAGVTERLCVANVRQDDSFEDDAVFEALADEPGEIDDGIDADAREFAS